IRIGSIRLLYATQTRVPHCSHSQLNDGVDGNGISSTRGQASTSRNSKSGIYQRYTRNLFGSCDKSRKRKNTISLTGITQSLVFISEDAIGPASISSASPIGRSRSCRSWHSG